MDMKQPTAVTDTNGNQIVSRTTSQGNIITDGQTTITFGFNKDQVLGLQIYDGSTIFLSITKDGIVLNDGTTDRVLIGKSTGGF
jgi:hypothetical protein